jgi:hypothetical protein
MELKQQSSLFRSRGRRVVPENWRGGSFTMIALGVMGILSVCACTSRGMYESNRQDARRACLNNPSGIENDKCLERHSQSYDEYTREREKVQREEQ